MVHFLPRIRLAQSFLKCKFPSVQNPLQIIISPSKWPLKYISPRAYFWNSTVIDLDNSLTAVNYEITIVLEVSLVF